MIRPNNGVSERSVTSPWHRNFRGSILIWTIFPIPDPCGAAVAEWLCPLGFHHPLRKCRQVRVPVRHYFVARGDQSLRGLVITVGAQWAFLHQLGEIPGGIPTSVGFTFLLLTRPYLGGRTIFLEKIFAFTPLQA